ncbi:hypothetical protein XH87_01125 [Bradyrhizobium sp. CCBAU 53415]|nr:hypothetical protein [Bradyrhizobium sp. CCBAU 53415]
MTRTKTAVAYARFSSELQKDRSIDDQVALCENIARQHGYRLVKVYHDRAKSAATMFERDGLLDLMKDTKAAKFDAVICESLDRISRDQEDLAGIHKRLRFREIALITSEGVTTDIHVGVRGIVGSMFLTDLSAKVRRGLNGRVREGKIPGSVTYGYRCVPGKPGEREIDPEQAKIVLRIFNEYASGKSVREIAAGLTRDGIPTPRGGKHWVYQTFMCGRQGGRGMFGNVLYTGKIVWNNSRTVLNPETGRKLKRRTKAEDVIEIDAPHLRIIPQTLFDRVNAMARDRARSMFGGSGKRPGGNPERSVRDSLLRGMLTCGVCGSHMRVAQKARDGSPRVACAVADQTGECSHRKTYTLSVLATTLLDGLKTHLTDPAVLISITRGFHDEMAQSRKAVRVDRDATQRQLNRVNVQLDRYVTAIGETDQPVTILMERIKKLEQERVGLTEKLRLIDAENAGNVVELHPKAISQFAANIETLHAALTTIDDPETAEPFRVAFRNLFETVKVHPTEPREPYELTPFLRISAVTGINLFPPMRSPKEILADQGVACSDLYNSGKP